MYDMLICLNKIKTTWWTLYLNKLLIEPPSPHLLYLKSIIIKEIHLDIFYQQLHRLNYPPLKDFVDKYYGCNALTQNVSKCVIDSNLPREEVSTEKGNNLPSTRKKITKTRQMYQLPGAFLDFLANTENDFVTLTSEVVSRPTSKDGSTTKMAIRLQDSKFRR